MSTQQKITVLGANGVVGKTLIAELLNSNFTNITAVARSYKNTSQDGVFYQKADLEDAQQTSQAVEGSDIAFVTVGLEYNSKIWTEKWPIVLNNIIQACLRHNTKLVFFDNVYGYGFVQGNITEHVPQNPNSKKGKVRAHLNEMLVEAGKQGLRYIIAKSGEFYGEGVKNSSIYNACIENILLDKKAFWLGDLSKLRTYTNVTDCAKALVLLASDEANYNQIWHLPTNKPLRGNEFVAILEEILGKKVQISAMKKPTAMLLSIFIPPLRELLEMYYQFDNDYVFDSSKFMEKYPNFHITDYETGFKNMIKSLQE